jgi:nucleoside-diphosphate-sugar epimerase
VRVLVAGGAGFVGSFVCEALVAREDEVVAVDNLVTGRRANVAALVDHPRFSLVEHDVCRSIPREGPLAEPVDLVMDLASPASPDDFDRIPLQILAVGSAGTGHLLELARDCGARFFLASTSEVYGDPLVHPQDEGYWGHVDPIGPRSCYDEAKRFSEALTMAHHRVHGTEVRIARIFNTYGPRLRPDDGRVVTNFVVQALTGAPLTVYGDGRQTRSFCYVTDEVAGLLALADHPGPLPGPVNVGNPEESTMLELAELVVELTGSSSPIRTVPLPPGRTGDPARRRPDITRARELLGWSPQVGLRDGLARTIDSLQAELERGQGMAPSPP